MGDLKHAIALAALLAAAPAFSAADPERAVGVERGKFEEPDALVTIHFNVGSIELDDYTRKRLASFMALAEKGGTYEVAGHTDSAGDDALNQALSEERANTVRRFLIARGVSAEQLTVVGYGETQPLDNNRTKDGRAQNRRVVVKASR